jgi:hypothetical protein
MKPEEALAAATEVSPLTVLVKGVLEWAFPDGALARLFERHAGGQYDRKLTLKAIFWLLVEVAAGARRSVFAAFQADRAKREPTIAATYRALYPKLGRTCPELACALLRHSADRLGGVLRAAGRGAAAGWHGYEVRILDGTDLDGTQRRLKVPRHTRCAGLPGRLVVEYDHASGLCVDAVAGEGAYACERKLVAALVAQATPGRLYVADRNFCCWDVLAALSGRGARFVIREHRKLRRRARGRRRRVGRAENGVVYEQAVWVEDRHAGARLALRRVIVKLDEPTRDGDREIRLLSNLPEEVSAVAAAEPYRERWTLEGHFDFVKNQLQGEIESLGRPRAAPLMMCLAMVAANALAVVRQALRASHGIELEELSGYYLADELAGNYRAVDVLVRQATRARVAALQAAAFWAWCLGLAERVRPRAFEKHPRGEKRPPPPRASGKKRKHYSTFRLLNEAKLRC